LVGETLFAERQVVVAAPDHRFAGRRCDGLRALSAERWITFPEVAGRSEAAARHVRRVLESAGVSDSQVLRIDSLTAQKRMVEAGFGIALMQESAIQEELAAGSLIVLDVTGLDVAVPVVLVTRRDGYLGAAARALREELRREAAVAHGAP
ncbi:MAG: substrate-binding domain-containing protein, partial [Candidatus Dormibacteraeota bacterium]|nr:substrate-binding domain-containing protein [Candidatus Dormibacteraeota bacterium]